ncbi:MAG: hypothetical protein II842_06800 [Butyrivibrio sp.]|nr:hypothetical protein [Butyrivibrio sp.]
MDFETFKENLADEVKRQLDSTGKEYDVQVNTVEKMNESYEALTVKPVDANIGVNINATKCFEAYENGKPFDQIAETAADTAHRALDARPDIDMAALSDYEQMKNKLSMEVVSAERNAELLESVPHKNIEDMAIVYRFVLDSSEDGRSSILVTNKMLENYGITAEQLHNDAMEIAPEIRPAVIQGMSEVMAEMLGVEQAEMMGLVPSPDEPIFVATVPDKTQGASVLAYQDFMDQAAEKLGGDFYVLPSSIHEILLVKDDGNFDRTALENMVKEVNATQVAPEDKLTDNVYHYDSKDKVFELAEKYEVRAAEKDQEKAVKADVDKATAKEEARAETGERKSVLADLKAKKEQVASQPKKDAANKVKDKGEQSL